MSGKSHLIWMGAGFVILLIIGKIVGISLILLFPFFCFFMMTVMILGMSHGDHDKGGKHE